MKRGGRREGRRRDCGYELLYSRSPAPCLASNTPPCGLRASPRLRRAREAEKVGRGEETGGASRTLKGAGLMLVSLMVGGVVGSWRLVFSLTFGLATPETR